MRVGRMEIREEKKKISRMSYWVDAQSWQHCVQSEFCGGVRSHT